MKKYLLFAASLLVSAASFAEWVKPTLTPQALEAGKECYLYNVEAGGFLLGDNEYKTRASVSPTLGHKVIIETGTVDGSYYITNFVLEGGMRDQWGYMFIDGYDAIYVDNTKTGKENNQYTFKALGDNKYRIGLSNANKSFSSEIYEDAYIGLGKSADDTRLYIVDLTDTEKYPEAECKLTWIFVTPSDYEDFVPKNKIYLAAVKLGNAITTAKATLGTDEGEIFEAEAVYANNSSSEEQLIAATNKLTIAINKAKYAIATADEPVEVLSILGIATDFNDSKFTGWTSTTSASNKQAANGNSAFDYSVTGNHYENWSGAAFTPGKISATATDIPAGVYRLKALAFSNTGTGVYLYAGEARTLVTAKKINVEEEFECYTVVSNGKLEIGLDIPVQGPNWVGIDNVKLEYLGNSDEAYSVINNYIDEATKDYANLHEQFNTAFQMSVYNKYAEAKAAFENVKTTEKGEAYATAYNAFTAATAALEQSISDYSVYFNKYTEANEWLQSTTASNDEVNKLNEYLESDDEPAAGKYNGNGGAIYIITNGLLTPEEVAKEAKFLSTLLNDAMASGMSDGDDCTSLIKNPDFTETGGWNSAAGINWPYGKDSFRVFEAWGRVCDVYQQLSGLQNGIYEMNLQAVYKADGDADIRQTYAYINDFDTKIGITTEDNPVTGSEEASDKFAEGVYPVKVYGLVTDNTMKIGIANRLRTGENGVLWAGGVKLTFRAKNAEACAALLTALDAQAKETSEKYLGKPEADALSAAIQTAAGVSGDTGYAALVELKKALDAANKSVDNYAALKVALNGLKETLENNNADQNTVSKANTLYSTVLGAYEAKSYNNEEAENAISDVKAMSVSLKMGGEIASESNPVDYTSAITNNNFDPARGSKDEKRIDGWVVEGALNGYKSYSCSFNKGTFKLSQELSGLPKGKYKVTVQTYYRAGSYEEEGANINAGKDTHLMKLFANDEVTSIMNLSEGSKGVTLPEGIGTKEINGITVPDGTGSSVKCYEAGLFLNELTFTVGEDGKAVIGLYLNETIGTNDYTVVGPWKLWYMGDATAVQDVTDLITNNNFDPAKGSKDEKRIDGWVVSGALNGYKSYSCSFNKGTFDLHQNLTGLPKGKYKVTVNTYYRAGSYEEEGANINAGKDTHLMKLYANDAEMDVMNLSEGSTGVTLPEGISTKEINGITVPDGTGASVKCYEAGLFLNELEFTVGDDGKATIGLKLDKTIGTNDYTVVGPWHLYYYGEDTGLNEQTVSNLIENNNFDPARGSKDEKRIDGWVVTGALNGYKSNTCSFNKGTFDLHQELTGLPEGTYRVTVHTYYRAGSYEEEAANINAGKDTHLMKLYANDAEKDVMNLSEGSTGVTLPEGISTKEINGITVPDGTGASVKCYEAGLFLNELDFYVGNDGKATIGLKLEKTIGTNDYTVVGKWDLYYYGAGNRIETVTEIDEVEAAPVEIAPVAYYSVSGERLDAPKKGINIVKMSNGSFVKIMVK